MHKQTARMINLLEEKGYGATRHLEGFSGGELTQVKFKLFREDDKKIALHKEWDDLKGCMEQENFYAIPASISPKEKFVEVWAVQVDQIKGIHLDCRQMSEKIKASYWFLQADEEAIELQRRVNALETAILGVYMNVRLAASTEDERSIEYNFRQFKLFSEWTLYLENLITWLPDIQTSEKINQDVKDHTSKLAMRYGIYI